MSLDVAGLIERTYRTYLYPPDYEPALVPFDGTSSMDATQLTIDIGAFIIPEDEQLLRIGSLVEADQELMRVVDFDANARTLTFAQDTNGDRRAWRGTTPATHDDQTYLVLAPSYPRQSVFESIRDNITMLSPKLFSVQHDNLVTVNGRVAGMEDDLAVEVLEVWSDNFGLSADHQARIVDFHPAIGGRAVILSAVMGNVWIRYRRRMGVPTVETDLLNDLGVEEVWEVVVMCGVAADLLVSRDLPQSQADYIGATLQAENIRVGTRLSIGAGLAQYRDILLTRLQAEMKNEYKIKGHIGSPFELLKGW